MQKVGVVGRETISENERERLLQNEKLKDFLLDPFSVIVKLEIVSYKPIGTKICILNNLVSIQEAGVFQPLVRFFFKNNKLDLHYLYNPIELGCNNFLTNDDEEIDDIRELFNAALRGIEKLKETYKKHSIIVLCLNYYSNIISNYLSDSFNNELFIDNDFTEYYTDSLLSKLNKRWSVDKIQVILELNNFLENNKDVESNVLCLETFMKNIDQETQKIIKEEL